MWFLVFFFATFTLDVATPVKACLITYWLTVLVEGILKAGENSNYIVRMFNPEDSSALGDERYKFGHAFNTLAIGGLVLGVYSLLESRMPDIFLIPNTYVFVGQNGENSLHGFKSMLLANREIILEPNVFIPIFIGTMFRFVVYYGSNRIAKRK